VIGFVAAFFAVYLGLAVACVWQWGSPDPASRIDVFSGGFFAAGPLWIAEYLVFLRRIGRTQQVQAEASGATFDPSTLTWMSVLPLLELAVFLDYGHWRLTPGLERPALQGLGLVLWVATPAWLLWADRHLGRHFASAEAQRHVLTGGPFRLVRHPRYAGLLASRAGFALVFASALAWALFVAWVWVVLRRMRREERHLLETFGDAYATYAARTPRFVPGVY
jgi:protein-S-isoprenylcysteine O-methyltransferase Ste14